MKKYYLIALVMVSCTEIPDPIEITKEVHDTTFVNTIVRDSIYVDNIIRDTTYVNVIDTLYIDKLVYDTVYLEKIVETTVHDTVYVPIQQPVEVLVKLLSKDDTQQRASSQVTVINWGEETTLEINELGDCVGYIKMQIVN